MPVLPGLSDDGANLRNVVRFTKEHGGRFVLAGGLTLSDQQREHYMAAVSVVCPELHRMYESLYPQGSYGPPKRYWLPIAREIRTICQEYGISDRMPRPILASDPRGVNKRVVERLAAMVYELELKDAPAAVQWAYRKAAWAIEDLKQDLSSTYTLLGPHAIRELKGVPVDLAPAIEGIIRAGLNGPA